MKLKIAVCALLLILVLVGGAFYWWQVRPSHIRHLCSNSAYLGAKQTAQYEGDPANWYNFNAYTSDYNKCLHDKGL